jgi:8-oxo-dGTP diphosphatase
VAWADGTPQAADNARTLKIFPPNDLPRELAFDHGQILADYLQVRPQWLVKIMKPY